MNIDITAYNTKLPAERKLICDMLAEIIQKNLDATESKIWHAHPVWFIEGNPIVGYDSLKDNIRLLFWSGQSFNEPGLKPEGSFKAAEARYSGVNEIDEAKLIKWLKDSEQIQWDYKNIVKRKGKLIRLKTSQ